MHVQSDMSAKYSRQAQQDILKHVFISECV